MAERKPIPKKTRFEVFKRDNFTCQYCGKSAPEVVLEIDHIKPVKEGGTNDIMNLITSCRECNSGKGARELDDDSAIMKQKKQLEELNERREQLEMMMDWRSELMNLDDTALGIALWQFERSLENHHLSVHGRDTLKKLIKKYSLEEVLDAIDIAVNQYLERDDEGLITLQSAANAISKLPGICRNKRIEREKPYMSELFHLRSIMLKRFWYVGEDVLYRMERAYKKGLSVESIRQMIFSTHRWSDFSEYLNDFLRDVDSYGED